MANVKDMKPEVLEQWVKDLRSGEFTQVYGNLVDPDQGENCRCALGVLLAQAEREGVVERRLDEFGTFVADEDMDDLLWSDIYATSASSLPTKAQEWAGIPGTTDPRVDGYHSVIELNDNLHLSFAEIADRIEAARASASVG